MNVKAQNETLESFRDRRLISFREERAQLEKSLIDSLGKAKAKNFLTWKGEDETNIVSESLLYFLTNPERSRSTKQVDFEKDSFTSVAACWGLFKAGRHGIYITAGAYAFGILGCAMAILGMYWTLLLYFILVRLVLSRFGDDIMFDSLLDRITGGSEIYMITGLIDKRCPDVFLLGVNPKGFDKPLYETLPMEHFDFKKDFRGYDPEKVYVFWHYNQSTQQRELLGYTADYPTMSKDSFGVHDFKTGLDKRETANFRFADPTIRRWFVSIFADYTPLNVASFAVHIRRVVGTENLERRDILRFMEHDYESGGIEYRQGLVKAKNILPRPEREFRLFLTKPVGDGLGHSQNVDRDRASITLIHGSVGTGKTALYWTLKPEPEYIGSLEASADHINQKLRWVLDSSKKHKIEPVSIYFDDSQKWLSQGNDESEACELILRFIDNLNAPNVTLYFTAPSLGDFPSRLRDRATQVIELSNPTTKQLRGLASFELPNLKESEHEKLGELLRGLNFRQALKLLSKGRDSSMERLKGEIAQYRASQGVEVSKKSSWKKLILPASLKEELQKLTLLIQKSDEVQSSGISIPRALLLDGPPGTGKTEIARTLANEAGVSFMAVTTADVKGDVIGKSGKNVAKVFKEARSKAPCILFVDEIESLVPDRGGRNADVYTREMVTQMLQEMDGVKEQKETVFVLAATNCPDQIDSAILSRFKRKMTVNLPDRDDRARMFYSALSKHLLDSMGVEDLKSLAYDLSDMTNSKSGRDIFNGVDAWIERSVAGLIAKGIPIGQLKAHLNTDELKMDFR